MRHHDAVGALSEYPGSDTEMLVYAHRVDCPFLLYEHWRNSPTLGRKPRMSVSHVAANPSGSGGHHKEIR
jgi:hypothetical protein